MSVFYSSGRGDDVEPGGRDTDVDRPSDNSITNDNSNTSNQLTTTNNAINSTKTSNTASNPQTNDPNFIDLGSFLTYFRQQMTYLTAYLTFVALPVFSGLTARYNTHYFEYAYTVSAVFISGFYAAFCIFIISTVVLAVVLYNVSKATHRTLYSDINTIKRTISVASQAAATKLHKILRRQSLNNNKNETFTYSELTTIFLIILCNVIIMVVVNSGYIVVVANYNTEVVTATQIALAIFKIGWNRWLQRLLLRKINNKKRYGNKHKNKHITNNTTDSDNTSKNGNKNNNNSNTTPPIQIEMSLNPVLRLSERKSSLTGTDTDIIYDTSLDTNHAQNGNNHTTLRPSSVRFSTDYSNHNTTDTNSTLRPSGALRSRTSSMRNDVEANFQMSNSIVDKNLESRTRTNSVRFSDAVAVPATQPHRHSNTHTAHSTTENSKNSSNSSSNSSNQNIITRDSEASENTTDTYNTYNTYQSTHRANNTVPNNNNNSHTNTTTTNSIMLLVSVELFNNIIIPCLATLVISPVCFNNIVNAPSNVVSTYNYLACDALYTENQFSVCISKTTLTATTTYFPPFNYSYQCSSVLVRNYASVYVFMFMIKTFAMHLPFVVLMLFYNWYNRHYNVQNKHKTNNKNNDGIGSSENSTASSNNNSTNDNSRMNTLIHLILPKLLWEVPHLKSPVLGQKKRLFSKELFVLRMISSFSLFLTFGVVFPPLAIVACIAMFTHTVGTQLILGRFVVLLRDEIEKEMAVINSLEQQSQNSSTEHEQVYNTHQSLVISEKLILLHTNITHYHTYQHILSHDIKNIQNLFWHSLYPIFPLTSIFYSFFIYDAYGDVVGWRKALWLVVLTIFMPVVIRIFLSLYENTRICVVYLTIKSKNEWRKSRLSRMSLFNVETWRSEVEEANNNKREVAEKSLDPSITTSGGTKDDHKMSNVVSDSV